MTLLTKFWRTKATTVVISIVAMLLVWGALAWPDWTSTKAAPYDSNRVAWQWMASLTPQQRQILIAVANGQAAPPPQPVPTAPPPPVIVRHVTIVRHVPAGTVSGNPAPASSVPAQAPVTSAPPQQVSAPAPSAPAPPPPAPVTSTRAS